MMLADCKNHRAVLVLFALLLFPGDRPALVQASDSVQAADRTLEIHIQTIKDQSARLEYRVKACEALAQPSRQVSRETLLGALLDEQIGYWAAAALWRSREAIEGDLQEFANRVKHDRTLDDAGRSRVAFLLSLVQSNHEPMQTLADASRSSNSELSFWAIETFGRVAIGEQNQRGSIESKLRIAARRNPQVMGRLHASWILASQFTLSDAISDDVAKVFQDRLQWPMVRARALQVLTTAKEVTGSLMPDVVDAVSHQDPLLNLTAIRCLGEASKDPRHLSVLLAAVANATVQGDHLLTGEAASAAENILSRIKIKQVQIGMRERWEKELAMRQDALKQLADAIRQDKIRRDQRGFSNPFAGPPDTPHWMRSWADWYGSHYDSCMAAASWHARNGNSEWAQQSAEAAEYYKSWADVWRDRANELESNSAVGDRAESVQGTGDTARY